MLLELELALALELVSVALLNQVARLQDLHLKAEVVRSRTIQSWPTQRAWVQPVSIVVWAELEQALA